MSEKVNRLISRQELREAFEACNHAQDVSLPQGILQQAREYMAQSDMRRRELKQIFRDETTLEQALAALELLPSATEYYLMGCYLLAQSEKRHWDANEILAAMKANCDGCIVWLNEPEKDFLGRIALHQASSFLTKEQLVQVIQLLDGYYLRQDILNRIAARDESKTIAILRQRLIGGQPATVLVSPSEKESNAFKEIDDAAAYILFEEMMTAPLNGATPAFGNECLTEPVGLIDRDPDADALEIFEQIKNKKLKSGLAIVRFMSMPKRGIFTPSIEGTFLSFMECDVDYFDNWFDEAWKVLVAIRKSESSFFLDNEDENDVPFAQRWYKYNIADADERIAREECYLVKLLRIAIAHGTSEQIAKILSFLTAGAIARHTSYLAAVDIPKLYSILKANGYSCFALQTVISALNWKNLPYSDLAAIAPCMLDDKAFLEHFLKTSESLL